jgi:colanic acid/amylovoran biosynthesis protein
LIATAVIVAGSRFHALLAALSQGVPVIAAGWSHKYLGLLDAYGSADALLELPASPEAVRACLDRALGPTRDTAVAALRTCAAQQRAQVEIMWDEVLTALASP